MTGKCDYCDRFKHDLMLSGASLVCSAPECIHKNRQDKIGSRIESSKLHSNNWLTDNHTPAKIPTGGTKNDRTTTK